jgi:argininosuccinate lyase
MSNISRLAEDLQVWSSDEYMLVDLDEAYAGTSSIMPQKKNPVVLEQAKAYAAESLGDLVALVASTKAASYTNVMDRLLIEPVSVETAVGCTRVMGGVVETLMPLRENMLRHLRAGFSTATDLADALVRKHGIGFRQAHDIVAEVTLMCIRDGKKAEEISSEMIREASQKTLGNPLELPQREIEAATNPVLNVERRKVPGGTSPGSVREMIKVQRRLVQREEKRSGERRGRIKVAFSSLEEAERAL